MKKKNLILIVTLLFSISISAFHVYQTVKKSKTGYRIPQASSFEKEWKRADSLQNKGLTQSALEVVKAIYSKAKSEKNATNFIRAIIEKMKYESYINEDAYVNAIADLEREAKESEFPIQQIIYSVTAETYWRYYQNNRYTFINRTETQNFENTDIRTWDLKKLLEKVTINYNLSLSNASKSKQTMLANYDDILIKEKGSQNFRPTLYDFLAHRAADYFMNEEPEITKPTYAFELDKALYFSVDQDFVKIKIASIDSSSLKLNAIKLLQELISFHQTDKNPQALIDVDLKRLKFVKQHAVMAERDSLYLNALNKVERKFESNNSSASATYLIACHYWDKSNSASKEAVSDSQNDYRKIAVQKCEEAISKFPTSEGAKNCSYLKSLIAEKSLGLTLEDANLPGKPILGFLKFRNVDRAYFKLVKLSDKNEFDIDRGFSKEVQKNLLNEKGLSQWSIDLPNDGDFCEHSVQFNIPALAVGHYIIFVGSSESFSESNNGLAHSNFWISQISFITQRKTDGSYSGYALNRESGEALKNVTLQLWSERYDYANRKYTFERGSKYFTNETGSFEIPFTAGNRNFYIEFLGANNDRLCSDYGFYQYKNNEGGEVKLTQTFFFTDRKIYRPGQTVYFKGILIEKGEELIKILPKQNTEVTFFDVNGQKVSSLNLTSNEYGTFNGSFITPQGVLNGQMYLTNGTGSTYFSVEEYKRPKFEVSFDALRGPYILGDSVTVTGKAIAYAGSVIDDAQVKFRVVRQAIFPYWWSYWRSYQPNSSAMEIANGIVSTNERGEYKIRFKSVPDLSFEKNNSTSFRYTVYADVTDISGETHSSTKDVNIGYTTLSLSANFPSNLDKETQQKFRVTSANLNGDYEPTKGVLRIFKLNQPTTIYRERKWEKPDRFILNENDFHTLFPNDLYNDEGNKYKWERKEKVAEIAFNTDTMGSMNSGELVLNNLKKWEQGEYCWEAVAIGRNRQEIKVQDYFTLSSAVERTIPLTTVNYFSLVTKSVEPGETARAVIGTKEKNVRILYEVECRNEIIKSEWLLLSNEQKIIDIPIEERYRGNIAVHFTFVKNNRAYRNDAVIIVPFTNKDLDITFETFRNKLYPGQGEEWKIRVREKKGDKVAAELMATLYDASLDAFAPNSWMLNLYQSYYAQCNWEIANSFKINSVSAYGKDWNVYPQPINHEYDALNWFGFEGYANYGYGRGGAIYLDDMSAAPMAMQAQGEANEVAEKGRMSVPSTAYNSESSKMLSKSNSKALLDDKSIKEGQVVQIAQPQSRKNFNETAFFYPTLETNELGEVLIKFTIPEALTKWKMLGLAHTKDLKIGRIENELLTQKDLMVTLNAPRFLREGDKISLLAKVSNLADRDLSGTAELQLFNALTMQNVTQDIVKNGVSVKSFEVKKSQSIVSSWEIEIPNGMEALTYKIIAKSGSFSDGEEMSIPVLTNRMLVTESLPLPIRGNETKNFTFSKLISQNNHSNSISNYKITLEFTSNPAWYAIQALPYLMDYPYECAEQTFARYYANSIASNIANSSPKIKAVFDSWKSSALAGDGESLLSNLEKNQELKSLLLEETPWVMQSKNESERKQRLALLFDLNKMSNDLEKALSKLKKMQTSNGGWPWFEGMPDDKYITQYIITGMGHLDHLGIKRIREHSENYEMIRKAVLYLDDRIREDYEWLIKHDGMHLKENKLSYSSIQYLYARSFFKEIDISKNNQTAVNYYKAQAAKYWLTQSKYMQGMIALGLNRYDNKEVAIDILKSLKENAISTEEMGMYWKENTSGYYWYQAPIETQALLIEAFVEVTQDLKSIESMKVWLLKHKQTNDWKTTKATSEACYALLLNGNDWLETELSVKIKIGDKVIDPQKNSDLRTEAGTGYFKTTWSGSEVKAEMGNIEVKPVKSDPRLEKAMWGAVYWQYFENLDKITPHASPLQIKKKIFLEQNSTTGPVIFPVDSLSNLRIGDKLKIRIELRVDRDLEYVQMKDMRASGFEPTSVFSSYKYQDGLGYFEITKDASTNFFFSYLPKGTYVFEYSLRVTHCGNFSNGITSIQSMYAPEFASHSEGVRLEVKR